MTNYKPDVIGGSIVISITYPAFVISFWLYSKRKGFHPIRGLMHTIMTTTIPPQIQCSSLTLPACLVGAHPELVLPSLIPLVLFVIFAPIDRFVPIPCPIWFFCAHVCIPSPLHHPISPAATFHVFDAIDIL
jgi:hypothetical protein